MNNFRTRTLAIAAAVLLLIAGFSFNAEAYNTLTKGVAKVGGLIIGSTQLTTTGAELNVLHGTTLSNGGIPYSTASIIQVLAGTATANLPLLSGSGTMPSWAAVSWFSGAVTSGGIPYFNSNATVASSGVFPTNGVVIGGGAGAAPTTVAVPTAPSEMITNAAGVPSFVGRAPVVKTANYAVLAADNGTFFATTGNAAPLTFTLPAVASNAGLTFTFMNTVGQNMLVTGPAGTLVAFNNAAATTVALQTVGNLIGSGFKVVCDGAKWIVEPIGSGTVTVS